MPSYAQKGFEVNAPLQIVEKTADGPGRITTEELGVVRAVVGAPADAYEGYLLHNGRLHPLPAGSFLDRRSGEFFWQPGAGFIGTYEFVFIRKSDGLKERIPLSIEITPRTADRGMLLPSRTIRH